MSVRGFVRAVLFVLTAASFYNMFALHGIRNTGAVSAILGELPRCEPGPK